MSARSAKIPPNTACYCPSCQRVFRSAPRDYVCPADATPLIGVGDPMPNRLAGPLVSVAVTLTVMAAVGLSIQLV